MLKFKKVRFVFIFCLMAPLHSQVTYAKGSEAPLGSIEVHGHRGARALMPENTLPAFQYALDLGVDVLELDVGVTKDFKVLVSHDISIDPKICLGPGGIPLAAPVLLFSQTLSELKKFDCGSLPNPKFPRQKRIPQTPMPTLEEVFALIAESKSPHAAHVKFNIETKIDPKQATWTVDPETFARLVLKDVEKFNFQKRVVIQSFDYRTLAAVRKLNPSIQISALTESFYVNSGNIASRTGAEFISPLWHLVHPLYVYRLHQKGVRVLPWTANEPKQWAKLVRSGADGIITDDPAGLIEFLKQRGLRK